MAETDLPKPQQIYTEFYLVPMGTMRLGASPYEPEGEIPFLDPNVNTDGYADTAVMADSEDDFYLDVSSGGAFTTSTGTFNPSDVANYCKNKSANNFSADLYTYQTNYYFSSYKNGGYGTFKNAKFDRIETTQTGWEVDLTVEGGTDVNHKLFTSGRQFCLWVTQWVNGSDTPLFNGAALYVYVKYAQGRVATLEAGRVVLKVSLATIDHFLEIQQRKLDFFSKEQAAIERAAWQVDPTTLVAYPDSEGNYLLDPDSGVAYGDPFQGFAAPIDTYNLDPTQPIAIPPCNENHLISHLNIPKAIRHVLRRHVKSSRNGGKWKGLEYLVDIQIHDEQDKEDSLVYFTKEDGTVLGSIQSALKHGVWDFYATAWNQLIMRKEWCADWQGGQLDGSDLLRPLPLVIVPGRSMVGQLIVNPGRDDTRISRVEVDGMPQLAAAEQALTSLNYNVNFGRAVFPNTPLSDIAGGSIYNFQGYIGFHVYHQARSLFAQQTQETTASLNSYPFANVFGMFKNIVSIRGKSPQGDFDYSPGATSKLAAWVGAGLGDVYTSSHYSGFYFDPTLREYVNVPDLADGDGINYDHLGKRFTCEQVSVNITQVSGDEPMMGYMESSLSMKEIVYFSNLGAGGFDQSVYDPHLENYPGPNTKPGDWTIMSGSKGGAF